MHVRPAVDAEWIRRRLELRRPASSSRPGETIEVENRGGETHTLTPVTQFGGGGIVGPINELIFGTPTPPIFFDPAGPLNFVPPGGHIDIGPLSPGTHLLICVIHPWMHETITVG
jgi:hypothetical protein